CQQYCGYPLTF
nr:immunoglobulin light chain junction region [Mus musculus]NSM00648.1 immunoglobulin light chain junction region [Mus musculus]